MTKWKNKLPKEGIWKCKKELRVLGLDTPQIRSIFNQHKPVQEYELFLMREMKNDLQETRDLIEAAVMYGLIEITNKEGKNVTAKSE